MSAIDIALEKVKELSESQATALVEWLGNQPASSAPPVIQSVSRKPVPPWMQHVGAFGGTAAMVAEIRRIQEIIDEEFEHLEPEEGGCLLTQGTA